MKTHKYKTVQGWIAACFQHYPHAFMSKNYEYSVYLDTASAERGTELGYWDFDRVNVPGTEDIPDMDIPDPDLKGHGVLKF